MLTALLIAGSLVPLAAMLACLFAAVWLSQSRQAPLPGAPGHEPR